MVGGWCTEAVLAIIKFNGCVRDKIYQNSLATVYQPPQESNNIVSRLSIKARCGLIKEEESRFRDKLDTQSHPLPLFDAQTSSGDYYGLLVSKQGSFLFLLFGN